MPEPTIVDGRYVLESQLAEGGMGCVYRARHVHLGKVFALKIIAPAFADDEEARTRFNLEAKLASEIAHPNIVSVVDYGEDDTVGAYMVMELVDGKPVLEPDGKPMAIKRALDLLGQLADVLDHIHRHGIVHGDIKADNVLVSVETDGSRRRDVVRVIDFGLAQRCGAQCHTVDGTPDYLAPERTGGGPATSASDLYALGVLGFELLTGRVPFEGSVLQVLMAHSGREPPSITSLRGEAVEPALERLIRHTMAKDPKQRPATAAAFRYELNAVMDMLGISRRRKRTTSMRVISTSESMTQLLFASSTLAQAVIDIEGTIVLANEPFAQLLGVHVGTMRHLDVTTTTLVACVPRLMGELRGVQHDNAPREVRELVERERDAPLELVVWLVPYGSDYVHVLVRCCEAAAPQYVDEPAAVFARA